MKQDAGGFLVLARISDSDSKNFEQFLEREREKIREKIKDSNLLPIRPNIEKFLILK